VASGSAGVGSMQPLPNHFGLSLQFLVLSLQGDSLPGPQGISGQKVSFVFVLELTAFSEVTIGLIDFVSITVYSHPNFAYIQLHILSQFY